VPLAPVPHVQTPAEALAQDAAEYARAQGVSQPEAERRLRAQQASVAATDQLQRTFRNRLAGISVEHQPDHFISILLTGDTPVAPQTIAAGGTQLPVVFRTGARATRDQIVSAMHTHRAAIDAQVPNDDGMGLDQRTGELVVIVRSLPPGGDPAALDRRLEAITGVPVRLRIMGGVHRNMDVGSLGVSSIDVAGGSRVEGVSAQDGRRYSCTTGFVVTNGARTGLVTAAHCPDALELKAPSGERTPLTFMGGWGWQYQDVQLHLSPAELPPLFFADTQRTIVRPVTGARTRTSTRAGDAVCARGETSGYRCSLVDLTDYAPPGELCGGPCSPTWVTVPGPTCRGGDSGGPVFSGTVAFGIAKGANYNRDGGCNFYFYMSTDYLPNGWALATERTRITAAHARSSR